MLSLDYVLKSRQESSQRLVDTFSWWNNRLWTVWFSLTSSLITGVSCLGNRTCDLGWLQDPHSRNCFRFFPASLSWKDARNRWDITVKVDLLGCFLIWLGVIPQDNHLINSSRSLFSLFICNLCCWRLLSLFICYTVITSSPSQLCRTGSSAGSYTEC